MLKYGITINDFQQMVINQGDKCAICGCSKPGGRGTWHVDHDHITGKVRGLLCNLCNRGLGNFRDNPDSLRKAAKYLEKD